MTYRTFWAIIVVGILLTFGAGVGRCAAYDYDWRCMLADCRIVKCSDTGQTRVEVE